MAKFYNIFWEGMFRNLWENIYNPIFGQHNLQKPEIIPMFQNNDKQRALSN